MKTLAELTNNFIEDIISVSNEGIERRNQIFKFNTGIDILDKMILPTPGDIILITGSSNSGKTTFCINWMLNFAKKQIKTLFISLQRSPNDIIRNICSNLGNIDLPRLKYNISYDEMDKLFVAMQEIKPLNDIISICRVFDLDIIENMIRKKVNDDQVEVVIIDTIHLIRNDDKYSSLYEQIKNTSLRLKVLAHELNILIVVTNGLNNDNKNRRDRSPSYTDVPFGLEYDFDIIFSLFINDDVLPEENESTLEINVMKNNGKLGHLEAIINLEHQKIKDKTYSHKSNAY